MEKKYELTDETTEVNGTTLYRIRALKDFRGVKKGDLGGFIEHEGNLSHDYGCWVGDEAKVYGDAWVYGNAKIFDDARVYGSAWVFHNAKVFGNAKVYDAAHVFECAEVFGNAKIFGNARIFGASEITGNTKISRMDPLLMEEE
ncbi:MULTISPECIES: hypothetical protein [unclassified Bartonella]|uniref:hypothetical protein n=1 Tax=unclassified Bartonella TaxID=2645622 RepID=UPI0020C4899C|nr:MULTISPECIES: hypothetical protein [unclassified Bartonella]